MSKDENKFQPIFQILHIKSAWFLLELAMALVTTIGMRFLQVWLYLTVIQARYYNQMEKELSEPYYKVVFFIAVTLVWNF